MASSKPRKSRKPRKLRKSQKKQLNKLKKKEIIYTKTKNPFDIA